jgi:cyclic pyranopterin phosphate synthase
MDIIAHWKPKYQKACSGGRILPFLTEIHISEGKGKPKLTLHSVELIKDQGLKGDAHGSKGNRQVSLLSQESIDRVNALAAKGFCVRKFMGNFTTSGLDFSSLSIGSRLEIGFAELEISQIGKECHAECPIFHQDTECQMAKESLFARVARGGIVNTGDSIAIR